MNPMPKDKAIERKHSADAKVIKKLLLNRKIEGALRCENTLLVKMK